MGYTNATLVGNQLKRTLSTDETALLAVLIPAVQSWIDLKTSSTFDVAAAATTRKYYGGRQFIDIEPCTNVTSVQFTDPYGVIQYTYQAFEYVLHPFNDKVKDQIELRGYSEFTQQDEPNGKFPAGTDVLLVTANFSEYDTNNLGGGVPADIQMVATRLAASLLNDNMINGVVREQLEGHLVMSGFDKVAMNDPFVQSVLELHRELLVD